MRMRTRCCQPDAGKNFQGAPGPTDSFCRGPTSFALALCLALLAATLRSDVARLFLLASVVSLPSGPSHQKGSQRSVWTIASSVAASARYPRSAVSAAMLSVARLAETKRNNRVRPSDAAMFQDPATFSTGSVRRAGEATAAWALGEPWFLDLGEEQQ